MGPDQGYVFDTLGEPHGACILPGEEPLEQLQLSLDRAWNAVAAGDVDTLGGGAAAQTPALPIVTTAAIREAWLRMTQLLHEAGAQAAEICASGERWSARARAAMDSEFAGPSRCAWSRRSRPTERASGNLRRLAEIRPGPWPVRLGTSMLEQLGVAQQLVTGASGQPSLLGSMPAAFSASRAAAARSRRA